MLSFFLPRWVILITQFIIRYSESKSVVQNINRIDPHAAFTAPDEDENTYPVIVPPSMGE